MVDKRCMPWQSPVQFARIDKVSGIANKKTIVRVNFSSKQANSRDWQAEGGGIRPEKGWIEQLVRRQTGQKMERIVMKWASIAKKGTLYPIVGKHVQDVDRHFCFVHTFFIPRSSYVFSPRIVRDFSPEVRRYCSHTFSKLTTLHVCC